jgi:hypothetical protein
MAIDKIYNATSPFGSTRKTYAVKTDITTDITEKRTKYDREVQKKVNEAVKLLSSAVNSGDRNDVAKYLNRAMAREHRFLQEEMMQAIFGLITMYGDSSYDERNKLAVVSCRELEKFMNKEYIGLPKIGYKPIEKEEK